MQVRKLIMNEEGKYILSEDLSNDLAYEEVTEENRENHERLKKLGVFNQRAS